MNGSRWSDINRRDKLFIEDSYIIKKKTERSFTDRSFAGIPQFRIQLFVWTLIPWGSCRQWWRMWYNIQISSLNISMKYLICFWVSTDWDTRVWTFFPQWPLQLSLTLLWDWFYRGLLLSSDSWSVLNFLGYSSSLKPLDVLILKRLL